MGSWVSGWREAHPTLSHRVHPLAHIVR